MFRRRRCNPRKLDTFYREQAGEPLSLHYDGVRVDTQRAAVDHKDAAEALKACTRGSEEFILEDIGYVVQIVAKRQHTLEELFEDALKVRQSSST